MRLWLDDVREPWLHGALGWAWAKTAAEAIALLETGQVTQASLDHDLGMCDECMSADTDEKVATVRRNLIRNDGCASYCSCPHNGTGYDVVCWMEEHDVWPADGVAVHSMNPVGRERMQTAIAHHYQHS